MYCSLCKQSLKSETFIESKVGSSGFISRYRETYDEIISNHIAVWSRKPRILAWVLRKFEKDHSFSLKEEFWNELNARIKKECVGDPSETRFDK